MERVFAVIVPDIGHSMIYYIKHLLFQLPLTVPLTFMVNSFAIVDFVTMMSSSSFLYSQRFPILAEPQSLLNGIWNHPTKSIKCKSISLGGSLICVRSITSQVSPSLLIMRLFQFGPNIVSSSEFDG